MTRNITLLYQPFREAALNDLEAYIYKVKNRLSEDEDALKEVSGYNFLSTYLSSAIPPIPPSLTHYSFLFTVPAC